MATMSDGVNQRYAVVNVVRAIGEYRVMSPAQQASSNRRTAIEHRPIAYLHKRSYGHSWSKEHNHHTHNVPPEG